MLVGSSCFASLDMRSYCEASLQKGRCEITGIEGEVVDSDDFDEFFSELLSMFVPSDTGTELYELAQKDWNIFANKDIASVLLNNIALSNGFANGSIEKVVYSDNVLDLIVSWENLKKRVSYSSRFFAQQSSDEQELWAECLQPNTSIPAGTACYRGRLNTDESNPYTAPELLKAPPAKFATSGRANSYGIPVLYLSLDKDTLMYETRALYGDKLSIGKFVTQKDLNVVDFNYVPDLYREYSRTGTDSLHDVVRFHFLMQAISKDMSKPMRRYDVKEIEYVPTQYVCDFIRQNGDADGIMFASSLHLGGVNLVLFDVDAADCESVEVRTVGQLDMHYED